MRSLLSLLLILYLIPTRMQSQSADSLPPPAARNQDSLKALTSSGQVTMRFGGDCLLANHYVMAAGDNIHWAFEEFEELRCPDISMVNLECPVTLRGEKVSKPFNFRMHPKFIAVLKEAGIDIVNIANNHIFDYGKVGLFDTIAYLDSAGMVHVGAGRNNAEAHRPAIVEVYGKRIGFLGYYRGGEAPAARGSRPGVAQRNIALMRTDIRSLKERDSVDYIVVNLHWGKEKSSAPQRWQIELAHEIIDAGADAVIGHHPHWLQGIERYKAGVIAYSLGNLIFGGNSRGTYDTGLFEIILTPSGPEFNFIPVRVVDWKAIVLTGAEADSLSRYVRKLSGKFGQSIFTKKELR